MSRCDWCDSEVDQDELLDASAIDDGYVGEVCSDCFGKADAANHDPATLGFCEPGECECCEHFRAHCE
jgi:hypothetical protein